MFACSSTVPMCYRKHVTRYYREKIRKGKYTHTGLITAYLYNFPHHQKGEFLVLVVALVPQSQPHQWDVLHVYWPGMHCRHVGEVISQSTMMKKQ